MNLNKDLISNILDKMETAISTAGGRANLDKWLIANTRHPADPMKPWTFKAHEWMLGILKSKANHLAVSKPTQTGCSELALRISLALAAKLQSVHIIYVMPTSQRARGYASSRVYPTIDAAPRLKQLLSSKVASTELIQLGNSFIHLTGAQSAQQAISVPARILIRDEYSFGLPSVLATYKSRLAHQDDNEWMILDFSSPLYPKSGITGVVDDSTDNRYLVYHTACNQWVEVEELTDLILPGFDSHLTELEPSDLKNPLIRIDEAYLRCRHCHAPISLENLASPEHRAWVPMYPGRQTDGFRLLPNAMPHQRNPPKLIRELADYGNNTRWQQYALGVAAESSDSTITEAALNAAFTVNPIRPVQGTTTLITGSVMGCDQGKLNYIMCGKRTSSGLNSGVLEVFHVEVVRQGSENEPGARFAELFRTYGCARGVIDAGPDAQMVKYVQARTPYNAVWGCYFVRTPRMATLEVLKEDEVQGMVKAYRTPLIDEAVAAFNAGKIKLPRGSKYETEMRDHLLQPKRLVDMDSLGEEAATWVSKSDDHWAFALFYLYAAAKMVDDQPAQIHLAPARLVTSVRMRSTPMPV